MKLFSWHQFPCGSFTWQPTCPDAYWVNGDLAQLTHSCQFTFLVNLQMVQGSLAVGGRGEGTPGQVHVVGGAQDEHPLPTRGEQEYCNVQRYPIYY